MLSLRSIWRGADMNQCRAMVPLRARSFGTKVPQDDASSRLDFKSGHYRQISGSTGPGSDRFCDYLIQEEVWSKF